MRKLNMWGLALGAVVVSGAVAATSIAPALTRADGDENAVAYVLDPESESYVTDLQVINITFDKEGVQVSEDAALPIVLKNISTGAEYLCVYPQRNSRVEQEGITGFELKFLTPAQEEGQESSLDPIEVPGKYEVVIPEGVFIYGDEVEDENQNVTLTNVSSVETITATYTIAEPGPQIAYTLDPEDGQYVPEIEQVLITFPETEGVEVNENMPCPVVLENTYTGETYICEHPVRATKVTGGGSAFIIMFNPADADLETENYVSQPITTPGTYKLSIKGGAFFYGKESTDEAGTVTVPEQTFVQPITATYTIVEPLPQVEYVLDPVDGATVPDLQRITISFPEMNDGKGIEVNGRPEISPIVLKNTETGEVYTCEPYRGDDVTNGPTFILNFISSEADPEDPDALMAIDIPGTYELVIPQGAFLYGDEVTENEGTEEEKTVLENITSVQAISATYTILSTVPEVAYVLEPENEAYVNELQRVTISFPDMKEKGMEVNTGKLKSIVLKNTETGEVYTCEPYRGDDVTNGPIFILDFISSEADLEDPETTLVPITTPGIYTLDIPQGVFLYGDEVTENEGTEEEKTVLENITPVQSITATYTIVEPLPQVEYVLDPVDGATVPDLQRITISFPEMNDGKGIEVNGRMENSYIVLRNIDTDEEYYCTPYMGDDVTNGPTFILDFISSEADPEDPDALMAIDIPGTYELVIPQGAFLYGDEVTENAGTEDEKTVLENIAPVQAISATYTILSTVPEVAYILDPEDTYVNELQRVTISFPDMKDKGMEVNTRKLNSIVLKNTETGEEYTCEPYMGDDVTNGPTFILDFISSEADLEDPETTLVPITTPGVYKLVIPQGAFLYGDEVTEGEGTEEEKTVLENITPVQAIYATYIISTSGVNGIFGDDDTEFDVYSINGIQILKAADSDAVNALPAGLYIINGKKVIKK